ncbi:MAG: hypothetical protein JSU91_06860 [Thermoplasmatales archaeon]|nr:MAG: hypothetical protein JSU91_06860 [Thermoplasmatales archaeon]
MKNNIRKRMILFLIIILFSLSVIITSAREDRLSKTDLTKESENVEDLLISAPTTCIKKEGESAEGSEEKITPSVTIDNGQEYLEDEYKDSLVYLGNQASREGSNDFEKQPVLMILAIISLIMIIMVCIIKRK